MIEPSEILFMGLGKSAVMWYRTALPALALGADWVGVQGEPPQMQVVTGLVRGNTSLPNYEDYKVIVIQQPQGRRWMDLILKLKGMGIKVLFEVDDYLHGVGKQAHHDFAKYFTNPRLADYELCMRVCDGIICSTEYIGRRYAKFNRNVYVCENGLDVGRYNLTRPARETVNIGWAGATGHMGPLIQWLNATVKVMADSPNTTFVAVGNPGLAQPFDEILGPGRAIGIPFTLMESYPSAMTMFDIALAPAGKTGWFQGKSDLRWLEAGALGIPIIADPDVYSKITHGVDGFHASTPAEVTEILEILIADQDLRRSVGAAAKKYVYENRAISIACLQWREAISALVGGYEAMTSLSSVRRKMHT